MRYCGCQLVWDSDRLVAAGAQALDWGPMPTWEKKVLMTVGVTASETVVVDSLVMAAGVHFQARRRQTSRWGMLHSNLQGSGSKAFNE